MVMVTSWNDWNEDTGIEPIGGTPTRTDDSPSGNAYTQGYTYGGEGRSALQALRKDVALLQRQVAECATRVRSEREESLERRVLTPQSPGLPGYPMPAERCADPGHRVEGHAHQEHRATLGPWVQWAGTKEDQ